jgi:hypothetical protein
MKTRIFEEIKKCTYRNVEKFFFKYFEKKDWTEQIKKIYQIVDCFCDWYYCLINKSFTESSLEHEENTIYWETSMIDRFLWSQIFFICYNSHLDEN